MSKLTGAPSVIPQPTTEPERKVVDFARSLLAAGRTPEQVEHSAQIDEWDQEYAAALVAMMRYIVWAESPIKIADPLAHLIGERFDVAQLPELVNLAAETYEVNLTSRGCDERNAGELANELLAVIPAERIPDVLEYFTVSEIMDDLTAGSPSLDYEDPETDKLAGQMAALLIGSLNAQDRVMSTLRLQVTCAIRERLDFMLEQRADPIQYGEPFTVDGDPR